MSLCLPNLPTEFRHSWFAEDQVRFLGLCFCHNEWCVEKGGPRCRLKKTEIYLQKNNKHKARTKSAAEPDYQKHLTMKKQSKTMKNKTMNK